MADRSPLALLHRLTEPASNLPEVERRLAHLLGWMQITLLALAAFALPVIFVFSPATGPVRGQYGALLSGILVMLAAASALNRAGHYSAAAWLTIAVTILGPWAAVVFEGADVSGNFVALAYAVIPVFLASILLSVSATALVAVVQTIILILIQFLYPAATTAFGPSLVTFVIILSVLSVVATIVRQQDMAQIERQSRQLAESEARLREQSVRDALTGLFNRRYLEETLERELRRADRTHTSLGAMMLDIDHFKNFNDRYGHAVGDVLLRELGALLRANIRGSDIACRYGGEEFLLLLPEASRAVTRERAEHIRAGAGAIRVSHAGQTIEPMTLSIGVANFPDDAATSDGLLKRADDALYRAKREGRDRVTTAEPAAG